MHTSMFSRLTLKLRLWKSPSHTSIMNLWTFLRIFWLIRLHCSKQIKSVSFQPENTWAYLYLIRTVEYMDTSTEGQESIMAAQNLWTTYKSVCLQAQWNKEDNFCCDSHRNWYCLAETTRSVIAHKSQYDRIKNRNKLTFRNYYVLIKISCAMWCQLLIRRTRWWSLANCLQNKKNK